MTMRTAHRTKPNLRGRLAGVLALQLHGGGPMWVELRDIKLKALPKEAEKKEQ